MNDIENDQMYRSWPASVQELLRATFPGVIRQIRRNFFNLVRTNWIMFFGCFFVQNFN